MSKLEFGCVEHLRWIRKHMVPQDDEHKVKTCPFCGKEPATRAGFAICINDDCEQSKYWSGLDIDEWNTRPIEDALNARIAELEAEVTELKPYRDGYDAYEDFPEEGENVIANLGSWLFLAQRRGDKWYDSLGQQAEIRGGVERWWKLPEVTE